MKQRAWNRLGNRLGYRGLENREGKELPDSLRKNSMSKGPHAREQGTANALMEALPGRRQNGMESVGQDELRRLTSARSCMAL